MTIPGSKERGKLFKQIIAKESANRFAIKKKRTEKREFENFKLI